MAMLKALKKIQSWIKEDEGELYKEKLDIITSAIIFSFDSPARRLGADVYCDSVLSWNKNRKSLWWDENGESLFNSRSKIVDNCFRATKSFDESNAFMAGRSTTEWSKTAFYVTLVRVVNALETKKPDPDFLSCAKFNAGLPHQLWHAFFEKDSKYAKRARTVLDSVQEFRTSPSDEESRITEEKSFNSSLGKILIVELSNLGSGSNLIPVPHSQNHARTFGADEVIQLLREMRMAAQNDALRDLKSDNKMKMVNSIDDLRKAIEQIKVPKSSDPHRKVQDDSQGRAGT
jgi:hypothetical protein